MEVAEIKQVPLFIDYLFARIISEIDDGSIHVTKQTLQPSPLRSCPLTLIPLHTMVPGE